ncbi:MAG: 16S rRNA (adenine(1518)-N(6)/adenine(1519)-N(6))-dimethyltransferase RsmA [Hydrogenothermaceae bacterium]|nr:16S rRNA (adenine(1518)-N(6)/adenine(1519)-N(6))-dimethyltransferase RsmA [Hydrogenothermaceae bacterium]
MKNTFRTKKKFGQHLLISKDVISKMVQFLEVKPEDVIVEIGVGTGNLTESILEENPKVLYGIEIDRTAHTLIEEKFKGKENFRLIKSDFFDVDFDDLLRGERVKFTGNLPYNVATNIMIKTVFFIDKIEFCLFMIQKEVAEKLIGKPRTKDYTFLSVFLQTFYSISYLMSVPARFFYPLPKVTSAIIKIVPKKGLKIDNPYQYKYFLSDLFQNRRKMLRSKLDSKTLEEAGISPQKRVEELSLEEILSLYEVMKSGHR